MSQSGKRKKEDESEEDQSEEEQSEEEESSEKEKKVATSTTKGKEKKETKKKGREKKERKKKDPNRLKRPLTAFMLFNQEVRPKIKAENPKFSFNDLAQAVSERWKNITPTEKKDYEDKAAELKKKYNEEVILRGGPEKKEKKEKVPKRAKTAFHFYQTDKRAELKISKPELPPKEVTSMVAIAWKALTADEKKPYEEKAKEAKENFKKDEKDKKPLAKKAKKEEKEEEDDDDEEEDDE